MKCTTVVAVVMLAYAGAFADTWSWEGKTGNVTIPTGTAATVADGDIATVEALTGIAIEAGASLTFANTQSIIVNANLSGAGEISANAAGAVTLGGDNVNHTGAMTFSSTAVNVTSRTGLGSPTRAINHEISSTSTGGLRFRGAGLTNDVSVNFIGTRTAAKDLFTDSLSDNLVFNGFLDCVKQSSCPSIYLGNYTFTGGWKSTHGSPEIRIVGDSTTHRTCTIRDTPLSITGGSSSYFTLSVDSGCAFRLDVAGNKWKDTFGFVGSGTVVCGVPNALCETARLCLAYNTSDITVDLEGNNQTVTYLQQCTLPSWSQNWSGSVVTEGATGRGTITSLEPATFTTTAKTDATAPVRFSGKVSYCHAGTGTQTLANHFSPTAGTLLVPAGAVRFIWGAGWGGNVELSGSGRAIFENGTSTAATLSPEGASDVILTDSSKLVLGEGVELVCNSLTVGGEKLVDNEYSLANLGDWIEGPGKIIVQRQIVFDGSVWIGGGIGGWSDPDNWKNGKVPQAGDSVQIATGARAPVADGDIDLIASLTSISIANGAELDFANTGKEVVLSAALSGTGSLLAHGAKGLTLAGDNINLTGPTEFTDTPVIVTSRTGLGSPTRTVRHLVTVTGGSTIGLKFSGNGLTNDVPICLRGDRQHPATYLADLDDPLVMNGSIDTDQGTLQYIVLGDWTFNGGFYRGNSSSTWMFTVAEGCSVTFDKTTVPSYSPAYEPWTINKNARIICKVPGYAWSSVCAFYGGGTVQCARTDVLPASFGLGGSGDAPFTLDLDGYDQTVQFIRPQHKPWSVYTPTEGSAGFSRITSATPATLTMTTAGTTYDVAFQFSGKTSFSHTGANTYTIVNQYSDTDGTLDVSAGTVAFKWGAGWGGDINLHGTGRVAFSNGKTVKATLNRDDRTAVMVADSAKLVLDGGVELRCNSFTVGGRDLPKGAYNKANLPDWIEGDGAILVVQTFVKGEDLVWTGAGGDGDVTKPENWKDGEAPKFDGTETLKFSTSISDLAVRFSGEALPVYGISIEGAHGVTLSAADGAYLWVGPGGFSLSTESGDGETVENRIGVPMRLEFPLANNVWTFPANTVTEFAAAIAGGTDTDALHFRGDGHVIFSGDNRDLAAKTSYTNIWLTLRSPTALGSPQRYAVICSPNHVRYEGAGLTNEVPVRSEGAYDSTYPLKDVDASEIVFKGDFKFVNGVPDVYFSKGTWIFDGGVSSTGSNPWPSSAGPADSYIYVTNKPLATTASGAYFVAAGRWLLGCPENAFGRYCVADRTVCLATNVLKNGSIALGSPYHCGGGTIDLGGFDQDISGISNYSTTDDKYETEVGHITSEEPAIFRLITDKGSNGKLPYEFSGRAGLENAGGATNILYKCQSSSTGPLKVSAGELVLRAGAGWTNVTSVIISGGRLTVEEESASKAFGRGGRSSAAMEIFGDGILNLVGGQSRVAKLTVNGVEKDAGFYGSSTCTDPRVPMANRLACIEGEGVIRTGKFGMTITIR